MVIQVEVIGGPQDGRVYAAEDRTTVIVFATTDPSNPLVLPVWQRDDGTYFVIWPMKVYRKKSHG